jgi:hypothetical protein
MTNVTMTCNLIYLQNVMAAPSKQLAVYTYGCEQIMRLVLCLLLSRKCVTDKSQPVTGHEGSEGE